MNCGVCEVKKILSKVLQEYDSCYHCRNYKSDRYQCNDCDFVDDTCIGYSLYELDIEKVKKDYDIK